MGCHSVWELKLTLLERACTLSLENVRSLNLCSLHLEGVSLRAHTLQGSRTCYESPAILELCSNIALIVTTLLNSSRSPQTSESHFAWIWLFCFFISQGCIFLICFWRSVADSHGTILWKEWSVSYPGESENTSKYSYRLQQQHPFDGGIFELRLL